MFKRLLRSKTIQSRVKWILAVVMVPPFAFFFHLWAGGGGPAGPGGNAGVLFGRQVPWETFQEEYIWLRRNAAAQFGTVPEGLEPYFRQQAWDRLMLKAEARKRVKVSDQQLAEHVQEQPAFQEDGQFSRDFYFRFIQSLGLSPAAFEERVRDDLRIEKLLDQVKSQVHLTDQEVTQAYLDDHQQIRASLVMVEHAAFQPQAEQTLTEQALREDYAAHPELVRRPAQRVIEYLERPLADVLQDAQPATDDELRAYYEERAEEFKKADGTLTPFEEVRAAVEQGWRGRQTQQRLTDLALDLEEDIDRGMRFVEIALSRGLQAKRIGPLERGQAPDGGPTASMISTAFDAPLGKMTPVFNTPIGVFLLIAIEESPASVPPFEQVQDQIRARLVQERTRQAANRHAQEVRIQLLAKRQEGLTTDEAYLVLEISPKRPAPFTRRGPIEGLDQSTDIAEALAKVAPGQFSDIIPAPNGLVVGFVEERLPVDATAMAAEKDAFRDTLLETRRQERLIQWLDELRERARLKSFLD